MFLPRTEVEFRRVAWPAETRYWVTSDKTFWFRRGNKWTKLTPEKDITGTRERICIRFENGGAWWRFTDNIYAETFEDKEPPRFPWLEE